MPLESCMILLDCSEYMRNGDYVPTRLEAQQDAAQMLAGFKKQSNPESTIGVSAGTELLLSPTDDIGKILNSLHGLHYKSSSTDITAAVQVASLALKHRRNKNGSQRIVLFVGTPLTEVDTRSIQKAGRQLKKNNVAIDVVALGELETNEAKLQELVDAANGRSDDTGDRTCHLVTVPAGVLPSDVLASSPVLAGEGGYGAANVGGYGGADANAFADFGGVDPNMDPELAMALRVSMEEERARQERAAAAAASAATEQKDEEMTDAAAHVGTDLGLSEEEALLQQALAMSMNENDPKVAEPKQGDNDDSKPAATVDAMDEDEDTAMQMALQLSMNQDQQSFQDPAFVSDLLGSMSGVDPNDPDIQEALQKAQAKAKDGDTDDSKKE